MASSVAVSIPPDWEDPDGLHQLLSDLRNQRSKADINKIRLAYVVAEQAHAKQTRASGEPYITHPLAVAQTLVDLHMDDDSVAAALLHDVVEDTGITSERIRAMFGEDVQQLVEGVTKLSFQNAPELTARERASAETTRAAESLRKMLLAMAKDFRVMVIKLCDRLHNMKTLDALAPEKRSRIANETLDVYAPLAARLGIWQVKWQLEDLAFKHLHPKEFEQVSELVGKTRKEREQALREAIVILKEKFEARGIKLADIQGRPKHLFSIFGKMRKQGLRFDEIYDLLALRVIVEDQGDCYLALGIVHDTFVPIPGLFYDYIARPKPNGYQSLHTKVIGPTASPLEVQIRTRAMHETAEFGVAAHWTYKEGKASLDETHKLSNLREQLFDWSSDARTSSDFLRSLSTDLFSEQVFVFTPKGDVIDLPQGSTPVDFAFRVHTQLGLTLMGAKVNGAMVPLSTRLNNGDVIELITRSNATPSLDWLEFIRSAHTRNKLKAYFRKVNKSDDAIRGRELLEKELRSLGLDPKLYLGEDKLIGVAKSIVGCETAVDLLARVGTGLSTVQSVVLKLRGLRPEQPAPERVEITRTREGKLAIATGGVEGVMVNRAKCCSAIPGDEVVGYVTRGRGIMIHRKICPNALNYANQEPDRLLRYDWTPDGSVYAVALRILTVNRQGLLMDISTILGETKTNVSALHVRTLPNHTAEIDVTVDVTDSTHLQFLMTKISNFSDVISILRLFGRTASK